MTNPREPFFGRTELEWEELEAVGWDLLCPEHLLHGMRAVFPTTMARGSHSESPGYPGPADAWMLAVQELGQLRVRIPSELGT